MKCAWICFWLIANCAANEHFGGGGVYHNYKGNSDRGVPGIGSRPSHIHDVLRPEINPNIPMPDNAQPSPNFNAFRGCERHPNHTMSSSQVGSHHQSQVMAAKEEEYLAILPQQDITSPIYIVVMLPSFSYEAEVQGSSMILSRCNGRHQCLLEDEVSLKGRNLINPHEWNFLHLIFADNKVTVDVGDRAQVTSDSSISSADMDAAEWIIESGRGLGETVDGGPFIVQLPCSEYREGRGIAKPPAGHPHPPLKHPQPNPLPTASHNKNGTAEYGEETGGGGRIAALVIGILLAVMLLALLIAVIISTFKKKRSMAVNEDTPLGVTNASYTQTKPETVDLKVSSDDVKIDSSNDTKADTSVDDKLDTSNDTKADTKSG